MKKVNFLFGIHNHQPVGNFQGVFKESFEKCYAPFLDVLEKHRGIRLSLHYSGCLLEWIEENRPEFLDHIRSLVERGQVEMLGGGFYEPLLSIIPEKDALGQVRMMTEYIKEKFRYSPNGIWLAERIWDTCMPVVLSKAGIRFTLIDESHFTYAGLTEKDMFGYYVTEKQGKSVAVFPIDKTLRYLIPFRNPDETLKYLDETWSRYGEVGITYGDDGEKFGIWPGTYQWVFGEEWLERFFSTIEENADWIQMISFSEYMEKFGARGRIYLPNASYEEMMEWALPVDAIERYDEMIDELGREGRRDKYKPFLRGGFWDNFLVKYPESNNIHKKMLYVSSKLREGVQDSGTNSSEIFRDLWKGQCNCAYWHGLFGGLYLNYLRHALYFHLIRAETEFDKRRFNGADFLEVKVFDFDSDMKDEIILSNKNLNVYISPSQGGSIFEIDYRPKYFNITNVLTRRKEGYHRKLLNTGKDGHNDGGQPRSIHDIVEVKEEGLDRILFYDTYNRHSFIDHFLGKGTTLEDFQRSDFEEEGDFLKGAYEIESIEGKNGDEKIVVHLRRDGHTGKGAESKCVRVLKRYLLEKTGSFLKARYSIINTGKDALHAWFAVENNVTLLAGNNKDRYYVFDSSLEDDTSLSSTGSIQGLSEFRMVDDWNNFQLRFVFSTPPSIWRFPIETVSQSESGFEKTYQGSMVLSHWDFSLRSGEQKDLEIALYLENL